MIELKQNNIWSDSLNSFLNFDEPDTVPAPQFVLLVTDGEPNCSDGGGGGGGGGW